MSEQNANGNPDQPATVAASATPTLEDKLSVYDRRMEELANMNRAILAKMDNLSRPTPAAPAPTNLEVSMDEWLKNPNGQVARVVEDRLKETMKPFQEWMVENRRANQIQAAKDKLRSQFGDRFNEIEPAFNQVIATAPEITEQMATQAYFISRGALESGTISRSNGSPVNTQPVNGPGVRSGLTPPAIPSSPPTPLPANQNKPSVALSDHEEFLRRQYEKKTGKQMTAEQFVQLRDDGTARDGVSGHYTPPPPAPVTK